MSASVGVARFAAAALVWLCLSLPALADGNEAVGAALAKLVKFGEFATGSVLANRERDRLIEFYAARGYKPIWARDDGPKGKARALLGELKISGVHGLSPQFYHVDEIGPLMASRQPAELARFDLLMTGALIEFGEDLANGRVGPATAGSENAVAPVAFDPVALLSGAEESGNLRSVVGGELNTDFRYIRLIAKLAELQRIAKRNLWPQIGDGGEIAAKAHDPRIPAIRKMLALDGDLPIALANGSDALDAELSGAIGVYQARHGLAKTGHVDAATLAELRVPVDARIRQVQINLERRRWQNRDLGADNVYVNLADLSLKLVRGGKSESFADVAESPELTQLPTFFGRIVAVDVSSGSDPVALVVESDFVDRIAARAGPRTIVVPQVEALARQLVDGNGEVAVSGDWPRGAGTGRVELKNSITLYVTYLTAWANRDGSLQLRPDKYERDGKLAAQLQLR